MAASRPAAVAMAPSSGAPAAHVLTRLTRPERVALRALLIGAVAAAGRPRDEEQLSRLVRDAPINALPAAAALHRIAGSVLRGLDGIDGIPDDVRAELLRLQSVSSMRHLLLTGALGEIGGAFDAAGLSWVVMKGPAVAALLYPEVTDRSYGDLDLLVDRRDYPEAMRILENLGYEHDIHNWALAEEMLAGEVAMARNAVHIDLHWHLHYSREDRRAYAFDVDPMIDRRRLVALSGVAAPTFDPVDTLLTVAFHAARSDGHRLIWFKDVERSLAVEQPDLEELVRRCHRQRCAAPVGMILDCARSLLAADVPDEVIDALAPRGLRMSYGLTRSIVHPVQFHERPTVTRAFTRSVRSTATASVAALPMRGVRTLRRHLFPPPENETDCPEEKTRYLQAVAQATEP